MEKVNTFNGTITDTTAIFSTVLGWLKRGFERYPTVVAVCHKKVNLTYTELDLASNKVANYLNAKGVNKGDRVGICLDRSIEMITCLIGILKTGAAYVPLDPHYPADRLQMMREDARLSLLITHKKFADRFDANIESTVVWEQEETEVENQDAYYNGTSPEAKDVAYVIFTSGSTGRPKGIEMPHRALSNLIEWQLEQSYFKKGANVIQYSSISFDVSFQEIATTLASGGTLFLVTDKERRDPRILLNKIEEFEIERLFIPFVALRSIVEVAISKNRSPENLKEVITAGEQLRVDSGLRTFFSNLDGAILENQYGPSETHVISAYLLDKNPEVWEDLPPIGRAIKNNSIYILDEHMKRLPKGKTGELYLAGRNLAHGYIGRDDLTKKSFIENPVKTLSRNTLYKTGDLGFYNQDGNIEFLGRADHQIKIRGYRIEPGEINTVGAKYEGIAQCITHAHYNSAVKAQLVTYYVVQDGYEVDEQDFRVFLGEHLPEYMVPAFVVELNHIPYTPSGKVDLKSFPAPQNPVIKNGEEKTKITYQSETEIALADIWGKILGFQQVPRRQSFFDLGGDSLNAVTLFMRIEEHFCKYLPLSVLTHASTIEELAKVVDESSTISDFRRFRSLQLIQQGNADKAPLFLVHGGAGNVLMFRNLAQGLPPEQPVYAFQWSGWDGYKGEEEIKNMAMRYKNELREAFPTGPYRLGGHCIGGIIAIEIAKLLKAEGAEVIDPILVSDAPNLHSLNFHVNEPDSSTAELEAFERMRIHLEAKRLVNKSPQVGNKNGSIVQGNYSVRRFPTLAKYLPFYIALGRLAVKVKAQLQLLRIYTFKHLSIKIPIKDRPTYSANTQLSAIKNHRKSIYNGDILYLKSDVLYGHQMGLYGWWDDIFFGFEELCEGRFKAHVIGAKHNDVLTTDEAHQIILESMFSGNEYTN